MGAGKVLELVNIKGEYNPKAVADYYNLDNHRKQKKGCDDLLVKAKQHLSSVGWSFHYISKKDPHSRNGFKRELRYCPPHGGGKKAKSYISLKNACHAYLMMNNAKSCDLDDKKVGVLDFDGGGDGEIDGVVGNLEEKKDGVCSESQENVRGFLDSFEGFGSNGGSTKMGGFIEVDLTEKEGIFSDFSNGKSKKIGVKRVGKKRKQVVVNEVNDDEFGVVKRKRVHVKTEKNARAKSMLYWLIEHKAVLQDEKVCYKNKKDGRNMRTGRVTRDGIRCDCCDQVFAISKFEAHAGSTYHRPAANIFLENGRSLSQCYEQLKRDDGFLMARTLRGSKNKDLNDEVCSVCLDGGELVLCDQCPSAFHARCLGMEEYPDSEIWFCSSCCCRICQRNIGLNDKENSLKCQQCEVLYHVRCLQELHGEGHREKRSCFCTKECEDVFLGLKRLLWKAFVVGENNLTCTLLRNNDNNVDSHVENHKRLNDAIGVMHERFDPVREPWTGRDIIEDVIFSRESEFKRLNFKGFYTMILERAGEVISVATVRVLGKTVAEVPLVATRFCHEKRGMCKIMMSHLENKLTEMGVQMLVLPSAKHTLQAWTSPSLGFSQTTNCDRLRFLNYTFLEFPDTVRCQKHLMKTKARGKK